MEATTYGYARVSAKDQCEERQLIALREFPVAEANIFLDKVSGKDFNRPAYRRLIRRLRPRDLLVIKSIDRLGRNYEEILEQWQYITKKKAGRHRHFGYASFGYQADGEKSHWNFRGGSGAADPLLRGPDRTGKHTPAAKGGHRRRQAAGRTVRASAQTGSRSFLSSENRLGSRLHLLP